MYKTIKEIIDNLESKGLLKSAEQVLSIYEKQNEKLIKKAELLGIEDAQFMSDTLNDQNT